MFWERFYNLCELENTKPLQVVKALNIAAGSITKWKNGAIPSGTNLLLIAEYFDVSIDYLMGRADYPFQEYHNRNFRKLLEQENGELKLKIFFMIWGLPEEDADLEVEIEKWHLEYLKAIENGMPETEALEKFYRNPKMLLPYDDVIFSEEAQARARFNEEHPEIRLKRIEELKQLLKEKKD